MFYSEIRLYQHLKKNDPKQNQKHSQHNSRADSIKGGSLTVGVMYFCDSLSHILDNMQHLELFFSRAGCPSAFLPCSAAGHLFLFSSCLYSLPNSACATVCVFVSFIRQKRKRKTPLFFLTSHFIMPVGKWISKLQLRKNIVSREEITLFSGCLSSYRLVIKYQDVK